MDGIKAGSLRRNKSEGERTQGPGFICIVSGPAPAGIGCFQTRAANNTLIESSISSANSSGFWGGVGGGGGTVTGFLFYFPLPSSALRPNPLVLLVLLLFMSQGCTRPFFCSLQRGNKLVSWPGYFDWRYTLATCLWKQCQSTTWLNCHIGSPGRGLW